MFECIMIKEELDIFYFIFRRSLSLIETLLNLAEQGHHCEVIELFRVPVKQCPEVFFLGLLQCKVINNALINNLIIIIM